MRRYFILVAAVLTFVSVEAGAQERDNTGVLGVWRGKEGDLPAVTLTVTDEGGPLAGAILFYLIRRDPGKEPTSSPGIPEPMLNLRMDGKSLNFEVSHRHAHP